MHGKSSSNMKRPGPVGSWWGASVVALAIVGGSLLGGCSSSRIERFENNLEASTEAISDGELDRADKYLAKANGDAESYEEKRKVQSLEALIAGARAMMEGDGSVATAHWASIRDPYLHREVRESAEKEMGVEVPVASTADAKEAK